MEEGEEYNFGEKKDRSVRTGRRARKAAEFSPPKADFSEPPDEAATEDLDAGVETKATRDGSGPPKPSRRVSGWGADTGSSRRRNEEEDGDDERLRPRSPAQDSDSDAEQDIPVIPELEENHEEDLTAQVAMAPSVAVNRVATYRELDNDLLRHAAFLTLDNEIDLKLLSKGLSAEVDVQEEDVVWEWDRLFTEVSSELLTEWERLEQPEDEIAVA